MSEEKEVREVSLLNYAKDLKKLIEGKFAIKIPKSWLNPAILEDFCGYNDLRKEQEKVWRDYLSSKRYYI